MKIILAPFFYFIFLWGRRVPTVVCDQEPTASLRGPPEIYTTRRVAPSLMGRTDGRTDGTDGTDGQSTKVSFNFFHTFFEFRTCTYILKYILKNCPQHSYGFQNFMPSWGSWSKISKLEQVRDFSFCWCKSSFLKDTYQW